MHSRGTGMASRPLRTNTLQRSQTSTRPAVPSPLHVLEGSALPGLGTLPDHRTHIWRGSQTPQPIPLFMELLPPKHELLGLLHDIIAIKGWWKLTLFCPFLFCL